MRASTEADFETILSEIRPHDRNRPSIGRCGDAYMVALPERVQGGQCLQPNEAIKLGAELIHLADLLTGIRNEGIMRERGREIAREVREEGAAYARDAGTIL